MHIKYIQYYIAFKKIMTAEIFTEFIETVKNENIPFLELTLQTFCPHSTFPMRHKNNNYDCVIY